MKYINNSKDKLLKMNKSDLTDLLVALKRELRNCVDERHNIMSIDEPTDKEFDRYNDLIEIEYQIESSIEEIEQVLFGSY